MQLGRCRLEIIGWNNSDMVIACFSGSPGGTFNCIKYANSKDKKVIIINPNEGKF